MTEEEFYAQVTEIVTTTPAWADAVCCVLDRIRDSALSSMTLSRRRNDLQGQFAHGNRAAAAQQAISAIDGWYAFGVRDEAAKAPIAEHMQTAKLINWRNEVWTGLDACNERLAHNCRTCWSHDTQGVHDVWHGIRTIEFAMQGVPQS